jgi:hypothetical protein
MTFVAPPDLRDLGPLRLKLEEYTAQQLSDTLMWAI